MSDDAPAQEKIGGRKWLTLVVAEAAVEDVGAGVVRIPEHEMGELGLFAGNVVEIVGVSRTVARVIPNTLTHADPKTIQMDGTARENAGVGLDDFVRVARCNAQPAETLLISPVDVTRPLPQAGGGGSAQPDSQGNGRAGGQQDRGDDLRVRQAVFRVRRAPHRRAR